MKKLTVTVGIPAYNEAANIAFLLEDVLKQRCESFVLEKVVVMSDGSSDETAAIASRYESSGVRVFDDGQRKGKSARSNELFDMSPKSDVVLLLDADIVLSNDSVFEVLVRSIKSGADLVSPELLALPPRNFFGRAIAAGHDLKRSLFSEWRDGKNIYQCHGAARAFSRKLLEKFRFQESVGEDAYSYLFVKKFGFRYASTRDAAVAIRVPETLNDHRKQSRRFLASRAMFYDECGKENVRAEYRYPKLLFAKHFAIFLLKHPLDFSGYLGIMMYLSLFSAKSKTQKTWEIASSSKMVR